MDNYNNRESCPNNTENTTEEVNCGTKGEDGLKDVVADVTQNNDGISGIAINSLQDMGRINFLNISTSDITRYHFPNVGVAFSFYNWYARLNGFSARKSKVRRNKDGEVIQQNFVCYRQGFKEDRFGNRRIRQREARTDTRCGCEAKCHVHIDYDSGRWYVRYFNDVHNHMLVEDNSIGFLPGHRKMDDEDIEQMNNFRKVGIRTSKIYGSLANQSGGYEHVGFLIQDMYNEADKQRRSKGSDSRAALAYLRGLKSGDPNMYWRHTVDNNGRLQHLFWSDGKSQMDYSVFGDVLAFDATYKKIRYMCPLVVFSGVNHHNKTIVFGSAIVADETEETYIWLLEQFLDAMQGKMPISVITDGDLSMKNAIRRVFPNAHHRLCAWHLIRNAVSNVKNPRFTSLFKKCMLGDYDIGEFEMKWNEMVTECGVEDNSWVSEMYAKKDMWATAHIRGKFFAGFRTTSRCEGLHSQLGKFVNSQNNLTEFLQRFKQCIDYFRFKEVEADFASIHGDRVLQTRFQMLERSASKLYTKDIFFLFRAVLEKACNMRVVSCKRTATCFIYIVTKYCKHESEWHVSFWPANMTMKCSCMRMESLGIPCDHIVAVMVRLDMVELPSSLVLDRWTKNVKESAMCIMEGQSSGFDSMMVCRYKALNQRARDVNLLGCKTPVDYEETLDLLTAHYERLKIKHGREHDDGVNVEEDNDRYLRNPATVSHKGCGGRGSSKRQSARRSVHCSLCGVRGHNRQTCPVRRQINATDDVGETPNDLDDDDISDDNATDDAGDTTNDFDDEYIPDADV